MAVASQGPGYHDVFVWMDPFFISSPTRVAQELYQLFTGADNTSTIWGSLARTVVTAMIGATIGTVVGGIGGLFCSHWKLLSKIASPFLIVANSVPKVALIRSSSSLPAHRAYRA